MTLDAALLSRVQWAWVIAWHILLPAFTVGLASYIALLEGLYYFTGEQVWFRISGFWTKIFAVSFGMGVVSGIIMPFQFGTNWSRFTDATADVLSPMMAYEGLMAFFLESTFLGVLLFGRRLVPAWAHFLRASWSHSVRCCHHFGYSLQTLGCRPRGATRLSMDALSPSTGSQLSSIHRSLIVCCITSPRSISRRRLS